MPGGVWVKVHVCMLLAKLCGERSSASLTISYDYVFHLQISIQSLFICRKHIK